MILNCSISGSFQVQQCLCFCRMCDSWQGAAKLSVVELQGKTNEMLMLFHCKPGNPGEKVTQEEKLDAESIPCRKKGDEWKEVLVRSEPPLFHIL